MENLKETYRMQSTSTETSPFTNHNLPVRRVIVCPNTGKIVLNPDSEQFIYFSKSRNHHAYYMFRKIMKIISDEIEKAKSSPYFSKLDIPDNFSSYKYFTQINYSVLTTVKNLFENYLPPQKVELVTLQYLNAFSQLFELCATNNLKKHFGKNFPEISDTSIYGGAYGINDAWLELLKTCIVCSKTCTVPVTKILEDIVSFKARAHANPDSQQKFTCNQIMLKVLEEMTYTELQNPEFFDKNNSNRIINLLELIEQYHIYSPELDLGKKFFAEQRKIFKTEYQDIMTSEL